MECEVKEDEVNLRGMIGRVESIEVREEWVREDGSPEDNFLCSVFQGEPIGAFFEWGMGEREGDPGVVVMMEEESDGDHFTGFDKISDGVFVEWGMLEEFEPNLA